jgi:predicted phosphohydrolase
LYAIGDLHLSFGADKPMDVFGKKWTGYVEKLREGLSVIRPEDTTVLLGDLSWAMDMQSAKEDFAFISAIPGRKIILKGNHDYWWTTAAKFYRFCEENGFSDLWVLNNNCYFWGDYAICGTRGWFYEEERGAAHDAKILNRELIRLETSLKAAGDREILCFLHYPPVYRGYRCEPLMELLQRYKVRTCYYGHLHSESHRLAVTGECEGIDFHLVAADYTGFRPIPVKSSENS